MTDAGKASHHLATNLTAYQGHPSQDGSSVEYYLMKGKNIMTKELLITDIYQDLQNIVGKISQEDFSTRWLNQSPSYLRTIKSQGRQPTIPVWESLLVSLIHYEKVITTKNNHSLLKQKAQQIRLTSERIAAHIASQQIKLSQRRNEVRILMLEAVRQAVKSFEGRYEDDAPPISIGF